MWHHSLWLGSVVNSYRKWATTSRWEGILRVWEPSLGQASTPLILPNFLDHPETWPYPQEADWLLVVLRAGTSASCPPHGHSPTTFIADSSLICPHWWISFWCFKHLIPSDDLSLGLFSPRCATWHLFSWNFILLFSGSVDNLLRSILLFLFLPGCASNCPV